MYDQNYLAHYGIIGMKWGQRRIAKAEAGIQRLDSGKHLSIGIGKNRQSQHDTRDRRILQDRISRTKKSLESNEKKDFNRLVKNVNETVSKTQTYKEFIKSHTYKTDQLGPNIDSVYIDNPKLGMAAVKSDRKTSKIMNGLAKKYPNVSAIPKQDIDTGKKYFEIIMGNQKTKVEYQED